MSNEALAIKWDLLPYVNGEGLDVGCADARPHDWFVGIDLNPGTGPRGPNLLMDGRKLEKIADNSQNFVFSSYLLNELDDWPSVLANWWRVLKDDGYLILFLPVTETCTPKAVVDAMVPLKPWQFIEARVNGEQLFQVYRKCDRPSTLGDPKPEKIVACMKLGAHGDALWASSVFPHLKEQGYHVILYTQDTGEEVLRHDPHIDQLIKFESRVPMGELGDLFAWMEAKYKECRILVECVEGTLLPSPQKIQYWFPHELRHKLMNHNYLDIHHLQGKVPLFPKRSKFYPSEDEAKWANELRATLQPHVVVLVPNGSSCTKYWPYAAELTKKLLEREDITVVMIGDERGTVLEEHPRLLKVGTSWPVRKAMTFVQLANVVVGEETGMLNAVSFNEHVAKIVLLTHSSVENLTRDWNNTQVLYGDVPCYPCHRLHYNFDGCVKADGMEAAKCQADISVDRVLEAINQSFGGERTEDRKLLESV